MADDTSTPTLCNLTVSCQGNQGDSGSESYCMKVWFFIVRSLLVKKTYVVQGLFLDESADLVCLTEN